VGRLLSERDYSRKINRRQLAISSLHQDEHLSTYITQKRVLWEHGWPVIHLDTKKRELIGLFKSPGTTWCRDPHRVNAYDFRSLAERVAIPYGIYDPVRNAGHVFVGTSTDASEFAVDAIVW
jgi:hypothetical protein